ncbi:MAG: GNAT family N-acetyltransferase [Promethearchaeota archaeon]
MFKIKEFSELNKENLREIYNLYIENEIHFVVPFDIFKRGTIDDNDFDKQLTLIVNDENNETPIAFLIAIMREKINPNTCYIKAILVDKKYRRQGIGNAMLNELIKRALEKNPLLSLISYGDSVPNYWEPGVDLRHTSLIFFFKKNRFRSYRLRQNLTVHLNNLNLNPKKKINNFVLQRIAEEDFRNTVNFVKSNFPEGTWAEEVELTFENTPPTTFIAKNEKGEIIGWASYNQQFPGSFGPTGVSLSLRGKGIGTELLYWCLWDMKNNGLDKCTIMWVEGDTVKFYSKILDAYIYPVFYPMMLKIKR